MKKDIREYFGTLKGLFEEIIATGANGEVYQLDEAIDISIRIIIDQAAAGGKLLFIGNGGSAAIASHMATDFVKNAEIPAMAFNDSSLLTCISNDLGYKRVFEKPINMLAEPNDILIAISSSGESENILLGANAAIAKGTEVITLSGFDENNPLRRLGKINFYVPSTSYGHVEIVHLFICHSLVDIIIGLPDRYNYTKEKWISTG